MMLQCTYEKWDFKNNSFAEWDVSNLIICIIKAKSSFDDGICFMSIIKSFSLNSIKFPSTQKHGANKKKPPHADEKNLIITADESGDASPAYAVEHSEVFGRWLIHIRHVLNCLTLSSNAPANWQIFSRRAGLVDKWNYHQTIATGNRTDCERRELPGLSELLPSSRHR